MPDKEEVLKVAGAMKLYGGHFAQALGEALYRADSENVIKIKNTWPDLWAKYLDMAENKE